MTADWIKMRTDLYRDPKVSAIAVALFAPSGELASHVSHICHCDMSVTRNVTRNAVVGALVSVWGIARHQGRRDGDDLVLDNSEVWVLDDIADLPGFGYAMVEAGWCVKIGNHLIFPKFFAVHNADPREKKRERDRERQRRHRSQKQGCDKSVTVTRDMSRMSRTEREKRESNKGGGGGDEKRAEISTTEMQAVADEWNMLGAPFGLARKVHDRRRKSLKSRLADDDWRTNWRAALERVKVLKFCRGGGERGWVATFDWFIKPNTVTEILEGKYDDRQRSSAAGQPRRETNAEARERGNFDAISKFAESHGVSIEGLFAGDDVARGAEANGGLHGDSTESVARRIGHVQADND